MESVSFMLTQEEGPMIRAILKKGKIVPLDKLPKDWHDGQELFVEGSNEPSDDPAEIEKWHQKLKNPFCSNH